ncbi:MAG TPA: GrpB family protein, partial [Gaiellaceae bacterium]|nr:GrpB family protein [Gaiellaceae bacterium]
MSEPVVIVEYDPEWPARFERERERVAAALGDLAEQIEQVGSTAVPGLAAKPVLDLDAVLRSIDEWERCVEPLAAAGYERWREGDFGDRRFFRRYEEGVRAAHLSLVGPESLVLREHLALRDLLRGSPELARRYGELKRELAAEHGDDRIAYTEAKTAFVLEALRPENAAVTAHLDGRGGSHEDAGFRLRRIARTAGLDALAHTLHGSFALTAPDGLIVAFTLGVDALYLPLAPEDVRTLTPPHDEAPPLAGWVAVDAFQPELP